MSKRGGGRYTPPKRLTSCRRSPTGLCRFSTRSTTTDRNTGQRTTTTYCSWCMKKREA